MALQTDHRARFDFEQVRQSLLYLKAPSDRQLARVAGTAAMTHLIRHGRRTGSLSPDMTERSLAQKLLNESTTNADPQHVARLVETLARDLTGQRSCVTEAEKYLPMGLPADGRLFFTWGYDIGVASGKDASINLAHQKFGGDAREVWFYCIHEMHHTGVMQLHPMPSITELQNTRELFELVEYLTFLEGTAVYAAYNARAAVDALAADEDYRAMVDETTMARLEAAYFGIHRALRDAPSKPLTDKDFAVLEPLSSGDRLWYRVGGKMARAIDQRCGREALKAAIRTGPSAFFSLYASLEKGPTSGDRRPASASPR